MTPLACTDSSAGTGARATPAHAPLRGAGFAGAAVPARAGLAVDCGGGAGAAPLGLGCAAAGCCADGLPFTMAVYTALTRVKKVPVDSTLPDGTRKDHLIRIRTHAEGT